MPDLTRLHRPGLGQVGAYQIGAKPYITGASDLSNSEEDRIQFPSVTRSITVINHSSIKIRVAFASQTDADVHNNFHFIELDSDEDSITMNVRADEIYISRNDATAGDAEYRVYAELTGIETGSLDYTVASVAGLTE